MTPITQAHADSLNQTPQQLDIPDEMLNGWEPSGMEAMQEANQLVRHMEWEGQCRKVFADPDLRHGGALCEAHRSGALPHPRQTVTRETALLPVCKDCCENECGFIPDDDCPPYSTCSCGTKLVFFGCWACGLEQMEQRKILAIRTQKRTLGLPPFTKEVLFCKCGKNVGGQYSRPRPEVVRQCACCHGFAINTFTNYAGEIVVFENMTADIKEIHPALVSPSVSVGITTGAGGSFGGYQVNTTAAEGGLNETPAPKQKTMTMPTPPDKYPQAPSRQSKTLPTLPRPDYLLPTSILPEPAPRTATKKASGRKRKAPPIDESLDSLGNGDEEGQQNKRLKATPMPQRKSQTGDIDKNAVLAKQQNSVKAFTPLMPFVPLARSDNNPPTMPNSTTAATNPTVASPAALGTHPKSMAPLAAPDQPIRPNGATHNANLIATPRPSNVDILDRKDFLRRQFASNKHNFRPAADSSLDLIMRVESEFRNKKGVKVFSPEAYDGLLAECGFEEVGRKYIVGFVEKVWNSKVAPNEVGLVAAVAINYLPPMVKGE